MFMMLSLTDSITVQVSFQYLYMHCIGLYLKTVSWYLHLAAEEWTDVLVRVTFKHKVAPGKVSFFLSFSDFINQIILHS